MSASASTTTFTSNGGGGTVNVAAARDCTWTIASDASWLTVEARSGQGEAAVNYTVARNSVPASRRGTVTVASHQLTIAQDGAPCRFELDRTSADVAAEGGAVAVVVSVLTGCSWTATSRAPWIAVHEGGTGNGAGRILLNVAANAGAARTGQVAIADQVLTIQQLAPPPPPPPTPPPPTPAPPPTPSPAPPPVNPAPPAPPPTPPSNPTPPPSNPPPPSPAPLPSPPAPAPTPPPPEPTPPPTSPPAPAPQPTPPPPPPPAPAPPPEPAPQTIDFEGAVSRLVGTCPTLSFQVGDRSIVTNAQTDFRKDACSRIKNGRDVKGRGRTQPNGSVLATRIEIR